MHFYLLGYSIDALSLGAAQRVEGAMFRDGEWGNEVLTPWGCQDCPCHWCSMLDCSHWKYCRIMIVTNIMADDDYCLLRLWSLVFTLYMELEILDRYIQQTCMYVYFMGGAENRTTFSGQLTSKYEYKVVSFKPPQVHLCLVYLHRYQFQFGYATLATNIWYILKQIKILLPPRTGH